jgi:hypothetical protein
MITFLLQLSLFGTELVNNGMKLDVTSGTHLVIDGDYSNKIVDSSESISNRGNIYISGNWNNQSISRMFISGTGNIIFNGITQNVIGKNSFCNIYVKSNLFNLESNICRDLNIENGGTFTVNQTNGFTILGNCVIGDGSDFINNGTLYFEGNTSELHDNRDIKSNLGNIVVRDSED